jgi:hypothetical protein
MVETSAAWITIAYMCRNNCELHSIPKLLGYKNKWGDVEYLLKIGSLLFSKYQNAGCGCKIYRYAWINKHSHSMAIVEQGACTYSGVIWKRRSHIITRLMSHPLWLICMCGRDIIFRMAIMCYCAQHKHAGRRHARIRWPVPPFFSLFGRNLRRHYALSDIPCTQTHTGVAFSVLYWEK